MNRQYHFTVLPIEDDEYNYVVLVDGGALVLSRHTSLKEMVSKLEEQNRKSYEAQARYAVAGATLIGKTPTPIDVNHDDEIPF